jgi:hypothetical protein
MINVKRAVGNSDIGFGVWTAGAFYGLCAHLTREADLRAIKPGGMAFSQYVCAPSWLEPGGKYVRGHMHGADSYVHAADWSGFDAPKAGKLLVDPTLCARDRPPVRECTDILPLLRTEKPMGEKVHCFRFRPSPSWARGGPAEYAPVA